MWNQLQIAYSKLTKFINEDDYGPCIFCIIFPVALVIGGVCFVVLVGGIIVYPIIYPLYLVEKFLCRNVQKMMNCISTIIKNNVMSVRIYNVEIMHAECIQIINSDDNNKNKQMFIPIAKVVVNSYYIENI